MATRVPPVEPGTRAELAAIEASIKAQRGDISLLYQVLLNSAPIAEGWEKMLSAVPTGVRCRRTSRDGDPARRGVESRALRIRGARPVARKVGVIRGEARRAARRQAGAPFTPSKPVLALTDAMTRDVQVPDALSNRARALRYARAGRARRDVAAYNMVSRFLEALQIGH